MSVSIPSRPGPLLSVVVPVHDRPRQLAACLEGLAGSTFPLDRFEVIVSDDGSREPMEPIVAGFADRLRISLVAHPNSGPAAARNREIGRAECPRGWCFRQSRSRNCSITNRDPSRPGAAGLVPATTAAGTSAKSRTAIAY